MVTICKDANDWGLLNEQVLLLSKKHGQLKQAITKMVQVVMGFLDDAPSVEVKLSTIEALRTVTEGKVGLRRPLESCSVLTNIRSSSKSKELESLECCPTSRSRRAI
jgi:hypothetical protein